MTKVKDFVFFAWLGLLLLVTCFFGWLDYQCWIWSHHTGGLYPTFFAVAFAIVTLGVWRNGLASLDSHFQNRYSLTAVWVSGRVTFAIAMLVMLTLFACVVIFVGLPYAAWKWCQHQVGGPAVATA